MRSIRARIGLLAGAGVLAGAAFLTAAGPIDPPPGPVTPTFKTLDEVEPRTPIESLAGDSTALHIIDQPGSYYLSEQLVGVAGKHGIAVMADDVTIDLNGFSLQGVPGSLDGVKTGFFISHINNLRVYNGTARDWGQRGINADMANNSIIENIRAYNNGDVGIKAGFGVSPPLGPIVRGCVAQGNASHGIHVNNGVVRDCVATYNHARGINAAGSAITNCLGAFNDADGIGGSGSVANSVATGNLQDGINFSGTVTGCRSSANLGDGIELKPSSVVSDCRSSDNGFAGILTDEGCSIRNNTARRNGQWGISILANCLVQGNSCDANTMVGITSFGPTSRIESNHVTNSPTGIQVLDTGSLIIGNSAMGNASNYSISPGNTEGPRVTTSGAITEPSAWTNFDL